MEVTLKPQTWSEETVGIIEAELAELPYDSFMEDKDAEGGDVLKAYIARQAYDGRMLKLVLSGLPFGVEWSVGKVAPENWNAESESRFEPVFIGRRIAVRAPFNTDVRKARFNIVIEPKMAFGDGQHQTTAMMMETMLDYEGEIRGGSVMDLGCGTGVLAILAAKMKASHVTAVDIDAVAARSAYDNAVLNRLGKRLTVGCGDASLLQRESYDVLLANIHRNIILDDIRTYAGSLKKAGMRYAGGKSAGGLFFASGFYSGDAEEITAAAEDAGLEYISGRSRDEWACLAFRRAR